MITITLNLKTATSRDILNAMTQVARIREATESFERARNASDDMGTLAIYAYRLDIPAADQHAARQEGKRQAQEAMAA